METLSEAELLGVGGIIGAFLAAYAIAIFVWWIFQIVAKWKIFTKAGEAGWKSIIPFYDQYTQFKFTWSTSKFWLMLILVLVIGVAGSFAQSSNAAIAFIFAIIELVASIAVIVITIKSNIYLAKAFGKGTGFVLGLLFLNPIFLLILGFGKAEYIGNKSEE